MTRHTQTILYHTLPIAFWLLAGLVCALPWGLTFVNSALCPPSLLSYLLPSVVVLTGLWILTSIKRHGSAVEPCFWIGILLGIASYWLPTVLFLVVPAWIYLYYRRLMNVHAFSAIFVGLIFVAIWAAVLIYNPWMTSGLLKNTWADFFAWDTLWAWLPIGAVLFAFIASSIARTNLRIR